MGVLEHRFTADRLLVIIPDRLSDLVRKGEVTERYYNPGELFREVHILMTNNDRPDPAAVQKMVGGARLALHNLPGGRALFFPTFGWQPRLMRWWARGAVRLAASVQPQLIRCHGALLNAFAASRIKARLGVPYLVSMHINPDVDVRGRARDHLLKRLVTQAQQRIEREGLLNADLVMPVYRPIVPYLRRMGVERFEVCYNTLNPSHLRKKDDYRLHAPVRVVSVGRQFREKNPDNLVRAVARLNGVHLTLIGDGVYHDHLQRVAAECGVAERVRFLRAVPNDELCRMLPDFDIFATHSEYFEIAKSVLEPLLTGLPVVINRRHGDPVPELTPDICMLVENSVDGYASALRRLIEDHNLREGLGRAAFAHARRHWSPEVTEAKFVAIYQSVLAGNGGKQEPRERM